MGAVLRASLSHASLIQSQELGCGSQRFALQRDVAVRVSFQLFRTLKKLFKGVVTSPNYPDSYPYNHERVDTIRVEKGKRLKMLITDFAVASSSLSSNCPNDHVTITDGDRTPLMEKTCGFLDVMPPVIMSTTNTVEIFFYSDSGLSGVSRGWSLSWAAVTTGETEHMIGLKKLYKSKAKC